MTLSPIAPISKVLSLEEWLENPLEQTEWIDGELVEKNGMTLKHSRIQLRLGRYWSEYIDASGQGGEAYTEVPCRTLKQGRAPDVAYLTPDLVAQFGDAKVLPQSFPLIAEIVSPTDLAEEVLSKATEYLQSGGIEVWLVYPENQLVLILTEASRHIFGSGEVVCTQKILTGFTVSIDELFA